MKGFNYFYYPKFRPVFLIGGLLLFLFLQACSTYSSSRGYPSRSYSYQPQGYYDRGHGYYGHRYYNNYQPGWFISAGYPGAYYGGSWGYGPMAYWPSYSYGYYRNSYYPYYDPWYYSYSRSHRHPYGSGYGSGYWHGSRYGYSPYYGNTHSYRPPGQYQQPTQNRPDPTVIPPSQRGRRGASEEYNQRVAEGLRQRETREPDRRSVTVVNEERDLSRSVGLAPTQTGDQGMTITNRSERKVRASRLEPVISQPSDQQTIESYDARDGIQRAYSTQPVQRQAPTIPVRSSRGGSRAYEVLSETVRTAPANQNRAASRETSTPVAVPPPRNEPMYRQAPARTEPPRQQTPTPRSQPAYEQRLDNVAPRADRRQARDREREREDRNR